MKKTIPALLLTFIVSTIAITSLVGAMVAVPSVHASTTLTEDGVNKTPPYLTYRRNTGYVDEVINRYGVQLQYADAQNCDAVKDTYKVLFGDGETALADCRGVVDHVYENDGTYKAVYTKNGRTIAGVKVVVAGSNKKSSLGLVLKNLSNPNTHKFKNGTIVAETGDRIAVYLDRAETRSCSLVNPDKNLKVWGPVFSSETNSHIIEINMPFDAVSQVYKIGIRCGNQGGVVRIDFKSSWKPAETVKKVPVSGVVKNPVVVLDTTLGKIRIELYEDVMPVTTANFIALTKKGFYDNTKFHRVIEDFMIQGGDPISKTNEVQRYGTGGPGYAIKDEFVDDPRLTNVRGTLAMANSGPNSGGSQFFINLVDNVNLDYNKQPLFSQHPVFGRVLTGMDVVDKIGDVPTGAADRPITPVVVKSVRLEGKKTSPTQSLATVKTYINTKYGYSFQYPKKWMANDEKSVVDNTNKLVSIVEMRDKKNTQKVSVIVNQNEMMYKHEALQTKSVVIDGETHKAYLFPEGYECRMASPGRKDCSFFVIPIYKNGVWYELRGIGKAKTITKEYQKILSSFKFD